MANNSKENYGSLTTLDTLPLSTTGTGSDLSLTSGSDVFTLDVRLLEKNFKSGSWIYDDTNDEVYKVKDISSDGLSGHIVGTSEDTVTLTDVKYIKAQDAKVVQMSILATAETTVNGVTLAAGNSLNFTTTGIIAKFGKRWCDAKIVDGATGQAEYIIVKY